jgi:hypothetical protein
MLNLTRAWNQVSIVQSALSTLQTLVPPDPSLFAAVKMFEQYHAQVFNTLRAIDAPKMDKALGLVASTTTPPIYEESKA